MTEPKVTPKESRELAVFVEQLARDIADRHLSPDQIQLRVLHKLSQLHLLNVTPQLAKRKATRIGT